MERIGLTPGSEIGGYTVVAPLGSGGMGTVYRAVDGGGTAVALKLLHPHVGADAAVRARLLREVAALQRLRHPAVAAVVDAEADSTEAFIVTELVPGPTLTERVRDDGPLDADALLGLAEGLRSALAAVHAAGVVHRDLKPSNVLLTDDGPVLIDFGLAQGVDDDATLTTAGFVLGTPGYLAPELLDGGEPGPGTDLWGWAALLAFAATGRDPFGARPVEAVLARARSGEMDLAGVGPLTAAALAGALRPDPADRAEPEDVVAALRVVAEEGELPAGSDAAAVLAALAGSDGGPDGGSGDDPEDVDDDAVEGGPDDVPTAAVGRDDVPTTVVPADGPDVVPTTALAATQAPTAVLAAAAPDDGDERDEDGDEDGDEDTDPDDAGDPDADDDGPAATTVLPVPPRRAGTTAVGPPEAPVHDGRTVAVPVGAGSAEEDRRPDDGGSGDGGGRRDDDGAWDDAWTDDDPEGVGWIEDDLDRSEGPVAEGSGYVRPPARRRWGTLLALAVLVGAAGALAPGATLVVVLVLLVLVRAAGSAVEAMHGRRERAGVRRSDVPLAVVSSPWHLLRAVVGLLPSLVVSASVGVVAAGAAWWLLGSGRWVLGGSPPGEPPRGPEAAAVVGAGVLLVVLVVWFGPLSRMTRTGARRVLAALAPGWVGALVVVTLALVGAAVLAYQVVHGAAVEWAPLPTPRLPAP